MHVPQCLMRYLFFSPTHPFHICISEHATRCDFGTTGIVPISCSAAREGVVELPADSKRISKLSVARARQVARRKQVLELVALGHGSVVELPAHPKDY